jgi:hypothetical protein
MNRYYYNLLNEGVAAKDENRKVFDSRSSDRLARDEVLVRPVMDPDRALLDAILRLQEDNDEVEIRRRA